MWLIRKLAETRKWYEQSFNQFTPNHTTSTIKIEFNGQQLYPNHHMSMRLGDITILITSFLSLHKGVLFFRIYTTTMRKTRHKPMLAWQALISNSTFTSLEICTIDVSYASMFIHTTTLGILVYNHNSWQFNQIITKQSIETPWSVLVHNWTNPHHVFYG